MKTATHIETGETQDKTIPPPAWMLGAAGLIPFVGLSLALVADIGVSRPLATLALMTYGAVILSFMAGVHWGLAMAAGAQRNDAGSTGIGFFDYAASVVPALVGWFALLYFDPGPAMAVIAAAFAGLLGYDFNVIRRGLAPRWYAALRFPLTIVVVLSLLLGGWASAYGF